MYTDGKRLEGSGTGDDEVGGGGGAGAVVTVGAVTVGCVVAVPVGGDCGTALLGVRPVKRGIPEVACSISGARQRGFTQV